MRRKTIKKNFWFSYEEDRQLKHLSSLLSMSESNTIRKLLYETQVKEAPPKEFYEAIDKINKIGTNINQIAKYANTFGYLNEYELEGEIKKLKLLIQDLYNKYI